MLNFSRYIPTYPRLDPDPKRQRYLTRVNTESQLYEMSPRLIHASLNLFLQIPQLDTTPCQLMELTAIPHFDDLNRGFLFIWIMLEVWTRRLNYSTLGLAIGLGESFLWSGRVVITRATSSRSLTHAQAWCSSGSTQPIRRYKRADAKP